MYLSALLLGLALGVSAGSAAPPLCASDSEPASTPPAQPTCGSIPGQNAEPVGAAEPGPQGQPAPGTLRMQVLRRSFGGAIPPPGRTPPAASQQPIAGVTVQVDPAETSGGPIAQEQTDARGQAVFTLPPGRYRVYVPRDVPSPGFPGGAIVSLLPDGRYVYAQAEATVPSDGDVTVTLTLTVPLP